jgi:hypothetical protein
MLYVVSASTLEQHVERFGDKKSTFGDFVERLRYNVASVDDVATKSRSTMLRSTCRTQHCRQCGPALRFVLFKTEYKEKYRFMELQNFHMHCVNYWTIVNMYPTFFVIDPLSQTAWARYSETRINNSSGKVISDHYVPHRVHDEIADLRNKGTVSIKLLTVGFLIWHIKPHIIVLTKCQWTSF